MSASTPSLPEQPALQRLQTRDGYVLIREIERGMIFWGEVLPKEHRDMEQCHEESNPCPWVVLSANVVHRRLPLVFAVPLTSKVHKDQDQFFRLYRIRVPENLVQRYKLRAGEKPLVGDSLALLEQSRSLAHARLLGDPIAYLDGAMLAALEAGAKEAFDFA